MASVELQKTAEDLIEQSRAGDQIATAMILETRKAALRGVPRAQIAFALLKQIAAATPIHSKSSRTMAVLRLEDARMSGEAEDVLGEIAEMGPIVAIGALIALPDLGGDIGITAGAVLIANGQWPISKRLVERIGYEIDDAGRRKLFFLGVQFCGEEGARLAHQTDPDSDARHYVHAGRCLGLARAIQRVRLPESKIGLFCKRAGWEYGEDLTG